MRNKKILSLILFCLLQCSCSKADSNNKFVKNKENKNIKYMVQIFDGNNTEEKVELENSGKLVNKDLAIRFNKKVKVFC